MPKKMFLVAVMSLSMLFMGAFLMPSSAEEHITAYISPGCLAKELESVFEADYGDVLTVVSGPWCRRMRAEMEAGDIKADVIYGAEPLLYMMLKDEGWLVPYNSPERAALKSKYKTKEIYFTLANERYTVIAYNKKMVKPSEIPTRWDDLTDPKWKGRVAISDATLCATAFAITCGLVKLQGWGFFERLKENQAMLANNAVIVGQSIASAEALVGFVPLDGALRIIRKAEKQGIKSPLRIVWPEDGAISTPRPIAIIKDGQRTKENTELARKFVDFVLSKKGQKIATKYGFITVRGDLPLPPDVPRKITSIIVDWKWAHKNKRQLRDRFESIMYGG